MGAQTVKTGWYGRQAGLEGSQVIPAEQGSGAGGLGARHCSSRLRGRVAAGVLLGLSLSGTASATGACQAYDPGSLVGTFVDGRVAEASGVVASQINPGMYWTHNDSGNAAEIYAFTLDGTIVTSYSVGNATNIDFEDMAIAPCPPQVSSSACSCIYIGDTGDNLAARPRKTVYVFPEPVTGQSETRTADAIALEFSYPADTTGTEMHLDAETLIVDPRDGSIYIVSKETSMTRSRVFKFPVVDSNAPVTLTQVGEIVFNFGGSSGKFATGGDMASDGSRLVVRTLDHALEFKVDPALPPAEGVVQALKGTPLVIPLPTASQGEAIAYGPDALTLVAISENVPSPIHQISCVQGSVAAQPVVGLGTACEVATGCSMAHGRSRPSWGALGAFFGSLLCLLQGRTRR